MKVLIYMDRNKLKPIGGPTGYLYNLSIGLTEIKSLEIDFLNEKKKSESTFKSVARRGIPQKIWKKLSAWKYTKSIIDSDGKESDINFNKYAAVHFHSTYDLYKNRNLLKNYSGKIILTSHTPEAPYLEVCDSLRAEGFPNKLITNIAKKLKRIDDFAFNKCTNLIFPCKEAMEPYTNTSEYFRKNYKQILNKTSFLPTGIKRPKEIAQFEMPNNIDKDKFWVTYVGRHNEIKGYDLLLKAARKIQNEDADIEFFIGGREEPMHSDPKLKNWHEFGWTNNPLGLEAASNLFVLPNRQTYFDLALIEALSVPSIVLISDSGGNKYFKRFNSNMINFFKTNDVDDLVKKIENIKDHYDVFYGSKSMKIYNDNFTPKIFAQNYIKVIREIVKER